MRFILREYTGNEVSDIAIAATPAELLDSYNLRVGCIWRIVASYNGVDDGDDIAVIDLTTSGNGYNVYTHQTVSHMDHLQSAVRMVRNVLQHYYDSGKLNDHADLIGVRVSPA